MALLEARARLDTASNKQSKPAYPFQTSLPMTLLRNLKEEAGMEH